MLESFKNPPADYRVTPFWFWNADLEPAEIERQVREMHAKGVGGFFIHGRFGLRTEYMGDKWMRCIEHACETARELGMHVYLYDENPFPSGVAGGEAMKDEKHFNKFLDIARQTAGPGETIHLAVPEGKLLSAAAVSLDEPGSSIDLTSCVENGKLHWTAPGGHWEALVFVAAIARYPGFIYGTEPDYFEKSLVDTFFRFTHERYAARLKPYFGEVIKGIFTDEPKIQCIYHMHDDSNTTAWFSDLPEQFKRDHGYDLLPHLPCLVADAGPMTGKVRRDFWRTVAEQYIGRYFARYRKWCEDNGIKLTGHLFLEEGLYANTMYQGDFPRVLSQFHIPGVDHLALITEGDYAIGQMPRSITRTHGQKLGSSTAHTAGLTRLLSETFGCSGWSLSMADMKWIVDWQASLGVNLLCPHAFYYSLAGVRKTDAPPSQFYQATYWPHYKLFADYTARLCYTLSQGKHKAQVALLYPARGFQTEWAPGTQGPLDSMIAEYFDMYCAYLLKEHVDYDILDEQAIQRAASVDGQLMLAGEEYELLIVPPTTALDYQTALKIAEMIEDGGKVITTMLLPVEDAEGEKHEEIRQIFSSLFDRDPIELRNRARAGTLPEAPLLSRPQHNTFFFEAPQPSDLIPLLRTGICKAIRPEVSVRRNGAECGDITYIHRSMEDAELFFFTNNAREPRVVQLSIRCDRSPHMLDLETGTSMALPNCTQVGSRTVLLHKFESCGSLLVYFGNDPALAIPTPVIEGGLDTELTGPWEFSTLQPNSLPLRDWRLGITTEQDHMRYEYVTSFDADFVPEELFLVLDDMPQLGADAGCAGSNCTVFVNDAPASKKAPWVLDAAFQCIDITQLVRKGANTVRIAVEHGGWSGDPQLMLAEPRLMGTFSLEETSGRLLPSRSTIETGSWTDQGYPYYSGTGVYTRSVNVPDFARGQRVIVRAENPADMVEFVINGASAGVRPWPPFEIDITPLVKPGPNTVELRITNSLQNALLSQPRSSGLLGGAWLVIV